MSNNEEVDKLVSALVHIYEQYCSGGHSFMNAGEDASAVLEDYGYVFDGWGTIIKYPNKYMTDIKNGDFVWYQDDVWTVESVRVIYVNIERKGRIISVCPSQCKLLTPLTEAQAKDPANNGRMVTVLPVDDLKQWQKHLVGKKLLLSHDGTGSPFLDKLDGTPSRAMGDGYHDNASYHKLAFLDDKPKTYFESPLYTLDFETTLIGKEVSLTIDGKNYKAKIIE